MWLKTVSLVEPAHVESAEKTGQTVILKRLVTTFEFEKRCIDGNSNIG
jgi:hypothetical protein